MRTTNIDNYIAAAKEYHYNLLLDNKPSVTNICRQFHICGYFTSWLRKITKETQLTDELIAKWVKECLKYKREYEVKRVQQTQEGESIVEDENKENADDLISLLFAINKNLEAILNVLK